MTTKSVMISFLAAIILNIKMEITRNSVLSLILDLAGWWVQDLLQPFTSITGISPPLSRQCIAMITWFPWLPRQQNIMVYAKHRAVREDEICVKKNESVTILSSNLSRGYLVHRPSTAQVLFQTHKINIYWITLLLESGGWGLVAILLSSSLWASGQETFSLGIQVSFLYFYGEPEPKTVFLLLQRIRKQSLSRQGRGGETPIDSGFWWSLLSLMIDNMQIDYHLSFK